AVEAWWLTVQIPTDMFLLSLRDPSPVSAVPSAERSTVTATETEMCAGGVTDGERTSTGRYPPGMCGSFCKNSPIISRWAIGRAGRPMAIQIKMTWEEVRRTAIIGVRRRIAALRAGRKECYGHDSEHSWKDDIEGAGGELVVARLYSLPWHDY